MIICLTVSLFIISFNRYMVECEWQRSQPVRPGIQGFNRYMVECEFGSVALTFLLILVLIDTWWNVNVGYQDMLSVGLEF